MLWPVFPRVLPVCVQDTLSYFDGIQAVLQEGFCLVNNQNLLVILTVTWGSLQAGHQVPSMLPQMVAGSLPRPSIIVSINFSSYFSKYPLTCVFPAFAAIYRVGSSVFCVSWGWVLEEGERTLRRVKPFTDKRKKGVNRKHMYYYIRLHTELSFLLYLRASQNQVPCSFCILCPQVVLHRLSVKSAAWMNKLI